MRHHDDTDRAMIEAFLAPRLRAGTASDVLPLGAVKAYVTAGFYSGDLPRRPNIVGRGLGNVISTYIRARGGETAKVRLPAGHWCTGFRYVRWDVTGPRLTPEAVEAAREGRTP